MAITSHRLVHHYLCQGALKQKEESIFCGCFNSNIDEREMNGEIFISSLLSKIALLVRNIDFLYEY